MNPSATPVARKTHVRNIVSGSITIWTMIQVMSPTPRAPVSHGAIQCLPPHQPHLPEHRQVLGRARLAHRQLQDQVGQGSFTRPQQHQDVPALRLGDRVERV
jgi:hypothetical protein